MKNRDTTGAIPAVFWPVWVLERLVTRLVSLSLRLALFVLGGITLLAGAALTMTICGAIAGVPVMLAGLMMLRRALF